MLRFGASTILSSKAAQTLPCVGGALRAGQTARCGSSNERCSSASEETYLPWNRRPWRLMYQHNARDLDRLDHAICTIISEDHTALNAVLKTTLGEGKNVNDCVEDPVTSLQGAHRKRHASVDNTALGRKSNVFTKKSSNAKPFRRKLMKDPETYIQIV